MGQRKQTSRHKGHTIREKEHERVDGDGADADADGVRGGDVIVWRIYDDGVRWKNEERRKNISCVCVCMCVPVPSSQISKDDIGKKDETKTKAKLERPNGTKGSMA